jgi:hypothetical protein
MKELAHGEPIVLERPVMARPVIGFPSRRSEPGRLHVVILDGSQAECDAVSLPGGRRGLLGEHSAAGPHSPGDTGELVGQRPRQVAVYGQNEFADAGGLMAYSFSVIGQYRSGATFIDKILKGANSTARALDNLRSAQCDPFGTPSTSPWTGAAIIVRCPRTRTCTVTRSRTSIGLMPSSLAG